MKKKKKIKRMMLTMILEAVQDVVSKIITHPQPPIELITEPLVLEMETQGVPHTHIDPESLRPEPKPEEVGEYRLVCQFKNSTPDFAWGWEMGILFSHMQARPASIKRTVSVTNEEQVKELCHRYGYDLRVEPTETMDGVSPDWIDVHMNLREQ